MASISSLIDRYRTSVLNKEKQKTDKILNQLRKESVTTSKFANYQKKLKAQKIQQQKAQKLIQQLKGVRGKSATLRKQKLKMIATQSAKGIGSFSEGLYKAFNTASKSISAGMNHYKKT